MAFDRHMQEFFDRLDACNDSDPSRRAQLEQELWDRFGVDRTVLILDMAGFTTKVQKHGLLYFLRKIRYMQKVVSPLLEAWKGELVKFEADNCYAVFASNLKAAYCAVAIHRKFRELTDNSPDVDDVEVSIGLARGRILLIPQHDFFGDAVNMASKLGEDLADHAETLVSAEMFADLQNDPGLKLEIFPVSIAGLTIQAGRLKGA